MSDYFSMSKAKRERATKLPLRQECINDFAGASIYNANHGCIAHTTSFGGSKDTAKYIVWSANTLPKIEALIEYALEVLVDCSDDHGFKHMGTVKTIREELDKIVESET